MRDCGSRARAVGAPHRGLSHRASVCLDAAAGCVYESRVGYDTVLLLVDESVFGACDRYLARAPAHDELVREITALLATDRPAGERELAAWLFAQATSKAPSLSARNVALSLWRDEEMGVAFPLAWSCALEPHLPLLRARHPDLRLPRWFDGNSSTGVYVEAGLVPEVLAFVEAAVARLEDTHASHFRGLVRVLEVAAARGLGYWEATELPVASEPAHAEWLADLDDDAPEQERADTGEALRVVASPFGHDAGRPIAREPDVWVVPAGDRVLGFDPVSFPPEPTPWKAHAVVASYAPWGNDLSVLGGEVLEHLDSGRMKTLAIPFPVGALRLVGGGVVALPIAEAPTGARPVRITKSWMGRKVTQLPLPASAAGAAAVIPFAGDACLLIWGGRPYRVDGERVEPLEGDALVPADPIACAVTMKDGSIVGAFGGALLRIAQDGARTKIGGVVDPIELVRGGEDAVVVRVRGGAPLFQVWWSATGETTELTSQDLALEEEPLFCYFAGVDDVLVVITAHKAHALDWGWIAARPRLRR